MKRSLIFAIIVAIVLCAGATALAAWGDYDGGSYTVYWDAAKGAWVKDKAGIEPYGKCKDCDGHILAYDVNAGGAVMSWEDNKGRTLPLHGIEVQDAIVDDSYTPEDNSSEGTSVGRLRAVQENAESAALTLKWEPVSTAEGYVLEKKVNSQWTRLATGDDLVSSLDTISYTDNSVVTGTAYEYRVKPYKTVNNTRTYGSYSGVLRVTPIVFTEIVPANFNVIPIEEGANPGFTLSWDAIGGADGYIVERSAASGSPVTKEITANTVEDTDAIVAGTQYTYRVYAYAGTDRKVTKDATATVTAVMPKPKAPANFSAVAGDSLEVTLTWDKVGGVSYSIERSADGSNWDFTKDGVTSPYKDKAPTFGTYYYRVRAYYMSGSDRVSGSYTTLDSGIAVDEVVKVSGAEARVNGIYYDLDYNGVTSPRTARVGDNTGSRCTAKVLDVPGTIKVGGVTYVVDAYRLSINGYSFLDNESVITVKHTGVNVRNLMFAFYGMKALKTVSSDALNGTIESMYYAFANCVSLINMPTIPDSVTNMSAAFYGCASLTSVSAIPVSVTNITGVFANCTSLMSSPVIPDSVTDMSGVFSGCASLISAPVIPDSVTILYDTFSGCTSLISAPAIPGSVMNIKSAFYGCTSLMAAPEIPSSVTDMQFAFQDCTSLTSAGIVYAPKTVRLYAAYANTKLVPSARPDLTGYDEAYAAFYGCPNA